MIDPKSVFVAAVPRLGPRGELVEAFIVSGHGRHRRIRAPSPDELVEIRAMPEVARLLGELETVAA